MSVQLGTYDHYADHPLLKTILDVLRTIATNPDTIWGKSQQGSGSIVDVHNVESPWPFGSQIHRMWEKNGVHAELITCEAQHSTMSFYWGTSLNPRISNLQSMRVYREADGTIWNIRLTTAVNGIRLSIEFRLDHEIVDYYAEDPNGNCRCVRSFQDHEIFRIQQHLLGATA